jgi:hypothetical protein
MYLRRCYRKKDGKRHGYWALWKAIARRGARGSAWWPTSVRWMRQGVWAFTNKPQVLSLLRSADCSVTSNRSG